MDTVDNAVLGINAKYVLFQRSFPKSRAKRGVRSCTNRDARVWPHGRPDRRTDRHVRLKIEIGVMNTF